MEPTNKPEKIIVHHTANASVNPQFLGVDIYHKQRFGVVGSLGFYIGYHYFIERDGRLIQGRADTDEGVHCKGHNFVSLGIAFAGDFDLQLPTARQRNVFVILLDQLLKSWQIKETEIYPHRAFRPTRCYGANLTNSWARETYAIHRQNGLEEWIWILRGKIETLIEKLSYAKQNQ